MTHEQIDRYALLAKLTVTGGFLWLVTSLPITEISTERFGAVKAACIFGGFLMGILVASLGERVSRKSQH